MSISRHLLLAAVFCLAGGAPLTWAADGGGPGLSGPRFGVIDRVDAKHRVLVINDSLYHVAPDARIHGRYTSEHLRHLKQGAKIRFTATVPGGAASRSGFYIYEIWILPKNYKIPRGR